MPFPNIFSPICSKTVSLIFGALFVLAPTVSFAQGLPSAPDGNMGFSGERLKRIDKVMNQYIEDGIFPGAIVSVAKKGQIVYFKSFGYSNVETKTPVKSDDIFRVYSMSKAITSAAVMICFEEASFMLDEPVSKYIPSFKNLQVFDKVVDGEIKTTEQEREMTVRDLLRQTCGLSYGWGSDPLSKIYQEKNLFDPNTTLEDMVEKVSTIPLYFQPGKDWQYSVAIDVLGRLVEIWSGQPLDEFMQKRIFDPLKMVDTGFFIPEEKLSRVTQCYNYNQEKGLTPFSQDQAFDRYTRGKNKLFSGGGGLVSTASDYMRFAQMLANGGELDGARILSRKTVELMSTDSLPDGIKLPWGKLTGHGYAFAMSVLTDLSKAPTVGSVGDYGWDGAASTYFRIDPQEDLVILLMTHRMPCDDVIQCRLKTLVYQAMVD